MTEPTDCPSCGSRAQTGRFCADCGATMQPPWISQGPPEQARPGSEPTALPAGAPAYPPAGGVAPPYPPAGGMAPPYPPGGEPTYLPGGPPPGQGPRPRRTPVALLAVLAVLVLVGAGAGTAWWLTSGAGDSDRTSTGTDGGPDTTDDPTSDPTKEAGDDPTDDPTDEPTDNPTDDDLGLGFEQADQPCSQQFLVVLASSGDPAAYESTLRPALEASPDARYLATPDSCGAFNQYIDGHPIYAAYLGPFPTPEQACAARAEVRYPGAYLRQLDPAADGRDLCSCSAELADLPELARNNAETAGVDSQYLVTDVQVLLNRAGQNPDLDLDGSYDQQVVDWVMAFQRENGLGASGVTDPATWQSLLSSCN